MVPGASPAPPDRTSHISNTTLTPLKFGNRVVAAVLNPVKSQRTQTEMIDLPKNDDSMASVETVKLCCPLSHRVISLGRFPI